MVERVSAASFIGRELELAELEASLADARAGRPQLVFVAGESGVGKSRLLSEFERKAAELGARTIGGECIELGEDELPYAPLVGAVRPLARADDAVFDDLADPVRAELGRLAPELGTPEADRSEDREGEAQRRLFDALLALLERLGHEQGLVFWLEDIHWADRSTRSFLAFLASSLRDERVVVVSTYRSDELHRRHPLRPLLNELERGICSRRLDLRPFDRDELSAQLADILGNAPSAEVVERLFNRSEGNPLFTEELLAASLDGSGALPPTLRDALLTRLDDLSADARRTLSVLSIAGRADDATLSDIAGLEAPALRNALRESIGLHLIRTDDADRFGFRHALFREVVYDDLLPGERSELHLALARTLERRADVEGGAWLRAAVAHHFHQAGEQSDALRAAVIAASRYEELHAFGEAASLLDRALGLWPRVASPEQLLECDVTELLARAARAHYLTGDDARPAALLEQALDGIDAKTEPLRAARLLGDLANTQWTMGEADRSRATLDRALDLVPDEPTEEGARLLMTQVRFKLLQGRFREIEPVAQRAIAMADALGLEDVKANVLHRLGPALIHLGECDRGEAMLREAIELTRHAGTNDDLATAYINFADTLHVMGRSAESIEILDEALPQFTAGNRARLWVGCLRAEVAFDLGDWVGADQYRPPVRALARGVTRANYDVRLAELALGRGELDQAREQLEDAAEMLEGSVEPPFIAAVGVLRAELARRARNVEDARAIIVEALDRIQYCTEDAGQIARVAAAGVSVEASGAEHARDLGDADAERAAVERAEMLLALTEASAEEFAGPVALAVLAQAKADAARAAARKDAAELWRTAADAWSELGRVYPQATALWRQAEALVGADERDAATETAREAHEIATRLGAEWLVAELESLAARARLTLTESGAAAATDGAVEVENPFGLTDRERQVLILVAGGATNREVAAELFMAEKTASVHVSRILAKLGVRSRTEAAAVAHRQGLAEPVESP